MMYRLGCNAPLDVDHTEARYGCGFVSYKVGVKKTVIDLFAGVGGLSLGAARAGFSVAAAVEIDKHAAAAHALNFPSVQHIQEDVAKLSGAKLLKISGIEPESLFCLIGGPPCQGFSEMGHKKASDPRNELFTHFFRLVSEIKPICFVAENVPGILSARNKPLIDVAFGLVRKDYTLLPPMKITASDYGAPTSRTRVFFIGHLKTSPFKITTADFAPNSICPVLVGHALEGLPAIRPEWQTAEQSWRRVKEMQPTEFSRKIIGEIPNGVGDPAAIDAYQGSKLVSGFLGTHHAEEIRARFKRLKAGQTDSISRAVKLDKLGFCPTLRAGTGPERGSYQAVRPIHPTSPRVITPREAARLQGFPDWFQFHPTKWHSFRQIGNSVSPIVAEHIMRVLARKFV